MVVYPAVVDVSSVQVRQLADRLRRHRVTSRSRWRRLSPTRQALLALVHLRKGETYENLAAGFGIGLATAWRYIREAVELLAAQAPTLRAAIWRLVAPHGPPTPGNPPPGDQLAILDGTVVPTDRVGPPGSVYSRLHYDGKHRCHGINLQALTDPRGNLIWLSAGLPAGVGDLAAARQHGIFDTLTAANSHGQAGLDTLADLGYVGAHTTCCPPRRGAGTGARTGPGCHLRIHAPYKRHKTNRHPGNRRHATGQRTANRAHAGIRARGERGFATLKTWRILRRYRGCPTRVGPTAHATLVLHLGENH